MMGPKWRRSFTVAVIGGLAFGALVVLALFTRARRNWTTSQAERNVRELARQHAALSETWRANESLSNPRVDELKSEAARLGAAILLIDDHDLVDRHTKILKYVVATGAFTLAAQLELADHYKGKGYAEGAVKHSSRVLALVAANQELPEFLQIDRRWSVEVSDYVNWMATISYLVISDDARPSETVAACKSYQRVSVEYRVRYPIEENVTYKRLVPPRLDDGKRPSFERVCWLPK
jgi:hypothetical protein